MKHNILSAAAIVLAIAASDAMAQSTADPATAGGTDNADKQAMEHISQKDPNNNMAVSKMNSFDAMDTGKKGMVTMDQAKGDPWLTKNFKMCDKDADGMVSRQEYAGCRAIK